MPHPRAVNVSNNGANWRLVFAHRNLIIPSEPSTSSKIPASHFLPLIAVWLRPVMQVQQYLSTLNPIQRRREETLSRLGTPEMATVRLVSRAG